MPLYITNASYDIASGGNTYLSSSLILSFPTITESLKIRPETLKLSLSGATEAVYALLLLEAKNADAYIYRHMPSIPETTLMFQGFTDDYDTDEDVSSGTTSVALNIANHWSNWDATSGTYLSDAEQQRIYPGDLGLEFSKITDFFLRFWGVVGGWQWLVSDELYTKDYVDSINVGPYTSPFILNAYSSLNDELVNANNLPNTVRLPIVYGQDVAPSFPVFRTIVGNNIMWVVYALAEGECEALVDITFGGVSYTDAVFSGLVTAYFHNGSATQTVDTALDAASALWTTAHRLRGICYVAISYVYDADVWNGADPEPVFEIKGKKLYDPRTTLTAYSKNPALVLYDYLTSTKYGKGIPAANIDGIIDGANYCDTLNYDHIGGSQAYIKLFEFHGQLLTSAEVKKNVEAILFTMRGQLPWISGKYTLVIERDDDTSVYIFDNDNIKCQFAVSEVGVKSLSNVMYYSILDSAANYQPLDIVVEEATYLAEDGRELKKSIKNKYEDNKYRAQNRPNTELKKSRQQITVQLSCGNAEATKVQTGQVVDITRSVQGWVNKLFRVTAMEIPPGGPVDFYLSEYEPTVFDWNVSTEVIAPANTTLPNPLDILPPTSLVLSSGTAVLLLKDDGTIISRITATWTAPVSFVVGGYNVYIKRTTDTDKSSRP